MPTIVLDAVAVTTRDMARTVAFYSALGFDFDGVDLDAPHVEPRTAPGAVRLMIDTADLMERLTGQVPRPATHAQFALLCGGPDEVDAIAKGVVDGGFDVVVAPWDAPWGQRYATVSDPDGYLVDLFAPLAR